MEKKLSPIKLDSYQPLREVVCESLRDAIRRGVLKPGERLMEIQLAEELGVSRTPVREAIRKLELEGYVIMMPRRGTYVASMSIRDINEIFEIRTALESLSNGLAAERITDEELESLQRLLVMIGGYVEEGNMDKIVETDIEFHDLLYRAARNSRLVGIISNLREQLTRFRTLSMSYPGRLETTLEEQREIVEAIAEGDVKRATIEEFNSDNTKRLNLEETKAKIAEILSVCIPYALIAALVCWYNYARFGNILEFGAGYSLTTNDMNHRGFNLNRLLRGLFSFYFQPPVLTSDFPYIESAIVTSSYMGRNIVEFLYGGIFATNLICLSVFAPLFGFFKKMNLRSRVAYLIMLAASFVIAGFDVNGAGIIYRYTCDMVPGVIIAALIIWAYMLGYNRNSKIVDSVSAKETISVAENTTRANLACRLFAVGIIIGLFYSLMVLTGPAGAPTLKDDSVYTYELIRSYFSF